MSETIHGACLCGRIAFDVHEPQAMGICHCTRCRRWSGGPSATVVAVAANNFEVTKGKDLMKPYCEKGFADRYFCSNCGSSVYTDGVAVYYLAAGVLQDVKLKPAWHIQVANKEPWDEIGDNVPQFAEYPPDF